MHGFFHHKENKSLDKLIPSHRTHAGSQPGLPGSTSTSCRACSSQQVYCSVAFHTTTKRFDSTRSFSRSFPELVQIVLTSPRKPRKPKSMAGNSGLVIQLENHYELESVLVVIVAKAENHTAHFISRGSTRKILRTSRATTYNKKSSSYRRRSQHLRA